MENRRRMCRMVLVPCQRHAVLCHLSSHYHTDVFLVSPRNCHCYGLLLVSFISTGVLAGVFDLQANTFAAFAYGYVASSPNTTTADSNDLLYTKPWHRIQPYLVGLVIGYLLFKQVRVPLKRYFKLVFYLVLWALAIILGMGTVYGLYGT